MKQTNFFRFGVIALFFCTSYFGFSASTKRILFAGEEVTIASLSLSSAFACTTGEVIGNPPVAYCNSFGRCARIESGTMIPNCVD
jgi:hypothetical protein